MPNNDLSSQPSLPADLQARLDAAGVTDAASLAAALQRDPALAADLQAFIEANAEALAGGGMASLVATFIAVEDDEQMMAFWRGVPAELEEPLMEAVAALIAHAGQAGDAATVEHLRLRLERFRQIHEAAQQANEQPPVVQAVIAFVQANDGDAAEAVFAQFKFLLQPYEAQQLLDEQVTSDDPVTMQRIAERRALLRRLRGAAPASASPPLSSSTTPTQVGGDSYQAGGGQYIFSAHAESGGTASVVNNLFIHNLERRWLKPAPPALTRDAVPRAQEMQAVLTALAQRESVAITGQAATAQALAVQGAPGVGKTTLAHLLARQLADDERYRDGVIWLELGPDFQSPQQAQPILRTWAGYATGFFGLPDNLNQLFLFEPEAVRSLLAEHPRLLVVLDNVWSLAAIKPLREALPAGAHLLITTRQRDLAHNLGAGLVEVGLLSPAEASALFELRLRWRPSDGVSGDGWAAGLMKAVGLHALGLDVALGVLRRYGDTPADWQTAAQKLIEAVGRGEVERLNLGADDPGHNVKAVILFSYDALPDQETHRRWRMLAAFAPEGDFATPLAAATWGCDEESAFETLTGFVNAALLERLGGGVWRQHGLLRAVGAALLRDAGEGDQAAAAHARAYNAAMRRADDEQRYYQMLPALPQLRHAFQWALANDLELALSLAANCANLQQQFGLAREGGQWSEQLLSAAQASRAAPATLARALGHRANRLSNLATLPGEDRRARLHEALAAYDDALTYLRPEVAPLDYARTQNNRAALLSTMATLPGEDRRARLLQALAAYDNALTYRRPEVTPLDYAATQNNRAALLSDLSTLPGEDRRTRLHEALAACDDALTYLRPEVAPLDYAATQNNRAALLSDLATLPGEDRRARLHEALAAYDDALTYRRPEVAPLDYATTQNNRGLLLSDLATLPGEDRRARLPQALAAYDDALTYSRPEVAPLDYAGTQNNRGLLLSDLATLPREDRRARLLEALAAYDDALRYHRPEVAPLDYARTQNNRAALLSDLATLPGEDRRARLHEALAACNDALTYRRPEVAPLDYAMTQNNRAALLSAIATLPGEDRRARLHEALAAYDDALTYRRPEVAPLDYATTQNNRGLLLSAMATLPGEDRRARLHEALAAYDDALTYRRPEVAPLDYATTQNNRGLLLSDLATLPGEDRRARLHEALAAYDDALRYLRPEVAPLDYAMTQNNRAALLSDLATLPGEDRRARLLQALAAYDNALTYRRPEVTPLDYAATQNNRAALLSDLATLPGEDRRARLHEALAAYDDALTYLRPEVAPLNYAATQNNRAALLSDLATLPGEDRRARLLQALAAYDNALTYRRPEVTPLDYAATQNNRAALLSDLATLPGEDRRARLHEALAAYDDALTYLRPEVAPLDYAATQNNRANLLSDLATLPGEDRRARLHEALAAYDDALTYRRPEVAPLAYAMTQGNLANLYRSLSDLEVENRPARQREALQALFTALRFFETMGHAVYVAQAQSLALGLRNDFGSDLFVEVWSEMGMGTMPDELAQAPEAMLQGSMAALLNTFAQVQNAEQMIAFWQSVPSELEEPFMEAVAMLIAQAEQAGDQEIVAYLRSRLDRFRVIRAGAASVLAASEPVLALLQEYQAALEAADAEAPQIAPWQAVVDLGERLLAMEAGAEVALDWDAVRQQVASHYNILGNAQDAAGDPTLALAAFERAVALQPDFAMWRRNQAGILIDLGRLDEARAAIDQARTLEPDAARLAQLEAQLTEARQSAGG